MRLALACLAILAVAASPRGGCGEAEFDPCGGKACGDGCALCPPDATGCVETADLKFCDGAGRCIPIGLAAPTCSAAASCAASGGTLSVATCCLSAPQFPNTCLVGACGCDPAEGAPRSVCECPAGECFDGTSCVSR